MTKPPALDPLSVPPLRGSRYPAELAASTAARLKHRLGDALGLKNFGVNLVRLPPGTASALRHWHSRQDEFVYVLEGEVTLVTDAGEQVLRPGLCAGFPAGKADGHCLINRSGVDCVYLEVDDRLPGDAVDYPDVDLAAAQPPTPYIFTRKDGSSY